MNDTQAFLTSEKFDELKKELDQLKTVRRKEIAESLEYARSLGDLSENAEYLLASAQHVAASTCRAFGNEEYEETLYKAILQP